MESSINYRILMEQHFNDMLKQSWRLYFILMRLSIWMTVEFQLEDFPSESTVLRTWDHQLLFTGDTLLTSIRLQ